MKNSKLNLRIIFIILSIGFMFFAISRIYLSGFVAVASGKADLSKVDFKQNKLVSLSGNWEFYWNQLLAPDDFMALGSGHFRLSRPRQRNNSHIRWSLCPLPIHTARLEKWVSIGDNFGCPFHHMAICSAEYARRIRS